MNALKFILVEVGKQVGKCKLTCLLREWGDDAEIEGREKPSETGNNWDLPRICEVLKSVNLVRFSE